MTLLVRRPSPCCMHKRGRMTRCECFEQSCAEVDDVELLPFALAAELGRERYALVVVEDVLERTEGQHLRISFRYADVVQAEHFVQQRAESRKSATSSPCGISNHTIWGPWKCCQSEMHIQVIKR